jgi:hypothetical protein
MQLTIRIYGANLESRNERDPLYYDLMEEAGVDKIIFPDDFFANLDRWNHRDRELMRRDPRDTMIIFADRNKFSNIIEVIGKLYDKDGAKYTIWMHEEKEAKKNDKTNKLDAARRGGMGRIFTEDLNTGKRYDSES